MISLFSFLKMAFGLVLLLSLESYTQTATALCYDQDGADFCADKDCNLAPVQDICPKTCGVCSPTDSDSCIDNNEECPNWEEDCTYYPWREQCSRTCGVCTPSESCVDTEKECPKYKHLCTYPSFVEMCPKTCLGTC